MSSINNELIGSNQWQDKANIMDKEITKYLIEVDKTVGKRIAQSRILWNISRKELAEVIAVSPQQLYKYETGKNRISVGRLSLIAKRFYKDLHYFLDEKKSRDWKDKG